MDRRRLLVLGLAGLTIIVIALTAASLRDNLTYYLYPTQAVDQRAEFPDGERFRLAGLVVEGSLDDGDDGMVFTVTDGGAQIEVVLTGTPPPLFGEGVPVLVEGAWEGEVFAADSALIRHDENYEIPEEGGAFPED
jgi:cytochrome c-type biogenesis protein CcmE